MVWRRWCFHYLLLLLSMINACVHACVCVWREEGEAAYSRMHVLCSSSTASLPALPLTVYWLGLWVANCNPYIVILSLMLWLYMRPYATMFGWARINVHATICDYMWESPYQCTCDYVWVSPYQCTIVHAFTWYPEAMTLLLNSLF